MNLDVRIDTDPRCPSITIYKNKGGLGFSEEESYFITVRRRKRNSRIGKRFNLASNAAKELVSIVSQFSATKLIKQKPTVVIPIADENSEIVLNTIRSFVKSKNSNTHVHTPVNANAAEASSKKQEVYQEAAT